VFITHFTVTAFNSSVLAIKHFIVVEKEQNVLMSHQIMQFLLVVLVQKYYLPPGAEYRSYATVHWGIRFRPQTPIGLRRLELPQDFQPLTVKYWLRVL